MSLWRTATRGLRALFRRRTVEAELNDEVRDYFERAREEFQRRGLSPREAARAARLEFGGETGALEELRSFGWENAVENALRDVSHGARRLRRSPAFTTVAVVTLATGIGAGTAIYSVVSPILFEPLPYPDAHRVVTLADRDAGGARLDVTYGTFLEIAARSRSFEALAVADRWRPAIVGGGDPERLPGDFVSAGYFRVLGVAPALGRGFAAADDTPGAPKVAIVSDGFAKRRFGGAPAALNRAIRLDGVDYTVVGVMPAGFDNVLAERAEVWSPRQYRERAPFESAEWGHHLRMVGRLAPGVSVEAAREELSGIGAEPSAEFPRPSWAALQGGLIVEPLQASVTAASRPVLLAVLSAVLLLLVIACANVTNLLLARMVGRRTEIAMRVALGAARGRLVAQLLTESLLLALVSGAAGLGLAAFGIDAILALAPDGLPRLEAVRLDTAAFVFALALTTSVGLLVGLAPALGATRPRLRSFLHLGLEAGGGSFQRLRRVLVVTEVALAVVLLAGAGLLFRSVQRLLSEDTGFEAANVLTMEVTATGYEDQTAEATLAYFQSVVDAVRGVPGVVEAAFTSQLPLGGDADGYGVLFEAFPDDASGALRYVVTPGWFRAMGIPLLGGRPLGAEDLPGSPRAVLLSESYARSRFGGRSPLGQRVRIGPDIGREDAPWGTVVGVVGDVKQTSLALEPANAFYVATGQWNWIDTAQSLVVRTEGDPAALAPAIRRAVWSVDATSPIARVVTMRDLLRSSEASRRFALTVFGIFAAAALMLAALGLYGVIAGSVAERTREIGLRSALGATPAGILALVVGQGMRLAALGVAIGLVAAVATTRGLQSLLFGVTSVDPLTYAAVIAVLAVVCGAASWIPASRASRVDPIIALRCE